jgi:fructosamine-3-kinase
MDALLPQFKAKVIPRLLQPLQMGRQSILPRLVHTDIWHGNMHLDLETQKPLVFDACCVYGHNESKDRVIAGPTFDRNPPNLRCSGSRHVSRS